MNKTMIFIVLLLSVVTSNIFAWGGEKISEEAWEELRRIHCYCLHGKWQWSAANVKGPDHVATKKYLENGLINKHIAIHTLKYKKIKTELATANSAVKIYRVWVIVLVSVLFIPLALSVFIFIIIFGKKSNDAPSSTGNGCPRCGSPIDLSTKTCKNCGTRV